MKSLPTLVSESKLAGSAGTVTSTVLVSTETTPKGTPPSLKVTEIKTRDHMDLYARKPVFRGVANNKGTDQPAHPRRLISTFVIPLSRSIMSRHAMSEISIF